MLRYSLTSLSGTSPVTCTQNQSRNNFIMLFNLNGSDRWGNDFVSRYIPTLSQNNRGTILQSLIHQSTAIAGHKALYLQAIKTDLWLLSTQRAPTSNLTTLKVIALPKLFLTKNYPYVFFPTTTSLAGIRLRVPRHFVLISLFEARIENKASSTKAWFFRATNTE